MENNQNEPQVNNNNNNNNNNNRRRFNNPFHLDPTQQSIYIERKLNRDMFFPLTSLGASFGENNDFYSMGNVNPLKESFFHTMEALIFPNATLFQISSILCYVIVIAFIIVICFGIDETNKNIFLQVKLSTVDTIGSFYPTKIKANFGQFYRLLTFHFLHFNFTHLLLNILCLISFCSFFEMIIKKLYFILIFFLSGTLSSITCLSFLGENERYCGLSADIFGILGASMMFYILNLKETRIMFGTFQALLIWYLLMISFFFLFIFYLINSLGSVTLASTSYLFGGFLFAIFVKPIRNEKWKLGVRIGSLTVIVGITLTSLVYFIMHAGDMK